MILDIAIGDAYGRAFEFNTPEFIKKYNNVICYVQRYGTPEEESLRGTYTDDAQMSIALVEHLLDDSPRGDFSFDKIGERFVKTYIRDPHTGYSKRITKALIDAYDKKKKIGTHFFINCQTDVTIDSNGSIMRSVPLGMLPSVGLVIRAAQMQSLVTHCSPAASIGSQIIAITSHYFYYRLHKGDLSYDSYLNFLDELNMLEYYLICVESYNEQMKNKKTIPCDANITVAAVMHILFNHNNVKDMLYNAINLTGDVDSIASISLGLASLKDDVVQNYPKGLIDGLENNMYGKDYLIELDKKIIDKYPR